MVRPRGRDARRRSTPGAARLDELGGDGFAAQRRTTTPLEAGAAVVTGGGALAAGFVLHVVIADEPSRPGATWSGGRWCPPGSARATGDSARSPRPWSGPANGQLTVEEAAELLAETFPGPEGRREPPELRIVVDAPAERELVEAIVRRNRVIRLHQLTKRYGTFTAVDGIDLDVPRGELFGFLGPNGAGKTTTIRMIAGILRPTSGTSRSAGIDIQAAIRSRPRPGWASSPTGPSSTTSSPAASSCASSRRCTASRGRRSSGGSTSCWSCSSSRPGRTS